MFQADNRFNFLMLPSTTRTLPTLMNLTSSQVELIQRHVAWLLCLNLALVLGLVQLRLIKSMHLVEYTLWRSGWGLTEAKYWWCLVKMTPRWRSNTHGEIRRHFVHHHLTLSILLRSGNHVLLLLYLTWSLQWSLDLLNYLLMSVTLSLFVL